MKSTIIIDYYHDIYLFEQLLNPSPQCYGSNSVRKDSEQSQRTYETERRIYTALDSLSQYGLSDCTRLNGKVFLSVRPVTQYFQSNVTRINMLSRKDFRVESRTVVVHNHS